MIARTGLADYQETPGNRGIMVFRRTEGDVTHFVLTTLWDSVDAIRHFAGDDPTRARYYDEATTTCSSGSPSSPTTTCCGPRCRAPRRRGRRIAPTKGEAYRRAR